MSVNSYSICDAEMQPVGAGVYLGYLYIYIYVCFNCLNILSMCIVEYLNTELFYFTVLLYCILLYY